jgi:sugar phosphate isomerase/epimerase
MMVRQLCKAPSIHVEIVDEGLHSLNGKRARVLREIGESYGFVYSVHAPFADVNVASPSRSFLRMAMKRLKRSLAYASFLGARIWVVHPGCRTGISMFYPGKEWRQNSESILELAKLSEDAGVMMALENMPEKYGFLMSNPEDFNRLLAEAPADFGVTLDVGHANLNRQIHEFIEHLSKKIVHVHASDNFGEADQHLGVGYGAIDWRLFAENLKKTCFSGTVVVESVEHVDESVQTLRRLLS